MAEKRGLPGAGTRARSRQNGLLILQVFIAGVCSLAVEVSASRLLIPYFGDSIFVWANLIGLILLYLTIGYYVGGRLADRLPDVRVFYALTIVAAIFIALVPALAHPLYPRQLCLVYLSVVGRSVEVQTTSRFSGESGRNRWRC